MQTEQRRHGFVAVGGGIAFVLLSIYNVYSFRPQTVPTQQRVISPRTQGSLVARKQPKLRAQPVSFLRKLPGSLGIAYAQKKQLWVLDPSTQKRTLLHTFPTIIIELVAPPPKSDVFVRTRKAIFHVNLKTRKTRFFARQPRSCDSFLYYRRALYCCRMGMQPPRGCRTFRLPSRLRRYGSRRMKLQRIRLSYRKGAKQARLLLPRSSHGGQRWVSVPVPYSQKPQIGRFPHNRMILAFVVTAEGDYSVQGKAYRIDGPSVLPVMPKDWGWFHGHDWSRDAWEWSPDGQWLLVENWLTDLKGQSMKLSEMSGPVWVDLSVFSTPTKKQAGDRPSPRRSNPAPRVRRPKKLQRQVRRSGVPLWIQKQVEQWRRTWEATARRSSVKRLSRLYHRRFYHRDAKKRKWSYMRRLRRGARRYSWMRVKIWDLRLLKRSKRQFTVRFRQLYQRPGYKDVGYKTLVWRKDRRRWKVYREWWKPLSK